MRPTLTVLLTTLFSASLLAAPAIAQDREEGSEEESEDEPPHALVDGAWALQFGIGSNFRLRSLDGSTLSFKRHTSAAQAWQIGVTLDGLYSDRSDEGDNQSEVTDRQTVEFTARYLVYPMLNERPLETIQLFGGAGPTVSFDRSRADLANDDTASTRSILQAGLSGVLGGEWFVRERLSLSAAYISTLVYQRHRQRDDRRDIASDGVQLNARGVRLGMSVYF